MMADNASGGEIAPSVVAAIAKELNSDLRDIASWLVSAAAHAGDQHFYHFHVGAIPVGTVLRFWLGNVDDDARIRFEGWQRHVAGNQPPLDAQRPVEVRGRNVIIVELINTWGGPSKMDLRVGAPGRGWIVDLSPREGDIPPYGLQRNYIITFDAN